MSTIAAGVWIAFWSLLSRVMKGESRWVMHAAVLFGVFATLLAVDWLCDLARFAFALEPFLLPLFAAGVHGWWLRLRGGQWISS